MPDREADPAESPDTPPELTPAESAEITKAVVISTADIDAAGALWRRYAPDGLAGLWAAESDKQDD